MWYFYTVSWILPSQHLYTCNPDRTDEFWASPGQNQHGKLLWKTHQFVITIATYLQHYLEQLYSVAGIPYVYLGSTISPSDLPKVATFLSKYQYPPEFNQLDGSFIMDLQVAPVDDTTASGVHLQRSLC